MRKTTLVNQALLRIRGLSGDRAHPSPSHVFPRSLPPRNWVKCFMITALNCILIRSQKLQRNVSSSTITELPKKIYICGPLLEGRLNWAIVCPDQQQIGNTFHNPRCILPASQSANFIATQLHFARTTSLSWGKSNLPECPAPQPHTGHVTCPPLVCGSSSVYTIQSCQLHIYQIYMQRISTFLGAPWDTFASLLELEQLYALWQSSITLSTVLVVFVRR